VISVYNASSARLNEVRAEGAGLHLQSLICDGLAAVYLPEVFVVIAEAEQAVARVVTLATVGAGNEAAKVHSLAVEVLGYSEGPATTARDEEHAKRVRRYWLGSLCLGPLHSTMRSMSLESAKTIVQILSALATAGAAIGALTVYRTNSRRERARWAESLYARFFERSELKTIRDKLDCLRGNPEVHRLVAEESAALTDYLNFFEFVAYLRSSKQLSEKDIEALFGYYLDCLRRHDEVAGYIRNRETGFEYLREILFHE
jgi:hypothetical protein